MVNIASIFSAVPLIQTKELPVTFKVELNSSVDPQQATRVALLTTIPLLAVQDKPELELQNRLALLLTVNVPEQVSLP